MSMKFRPPIYVLVALVVSFLASAFVALQRLKAENSYRATHVVAAIEDLRAAAAVSGVKMPDYLVQMKAAGLTGVVVSEDTFETLQTSGRIAPTGLTPPTYTCDDPVVWDRIRVISKERFPKGAVATRIVSKEGAITIPLSPTELKTFGFGFDAKTCAAVRQAGLEVVARVGNPPACSEATIRSIVTDLKRVRAVGVVFLGDQVLGWRDAIGVTAEQFKRAGIWYGSVEFGNQAGDRKLQTELLDQTLRVHSILAAEIAQSDIQTIEDRYIRAATERNIRVLLVRPDGPADKNPSKGFAEFINTIKEGLVSRGSAAREPKPIKDPEISLIFRLLIAAGVSVLSLWLVNCLFDEKWLTIVVGVLCLGLFGMMLTGSGAKYFSFLAAMAFPTWAILSVLSSTNQTKPNWILGFLIISGISIVGGLHVAGLITQLPYMLHLEQFSGVKIAHFVPPMFVGGYLLWEQMGMRAALSNSVKWIDVALLMGVGAAVFLVVLRTGNDAPSAVSGWELKMRDLMDRYLIERPRTKEALLGHPALVVALGLVATEQRRYLPLMAILAGVGQASIVNTFCHLHTPLEVTLIRVLVGLLCGGILGALIWLLVRRVFQGGRV